MNNSNSEAYVPEYNPRKYGTAYRVTRILSKICLFAMIAGVTILFLIAWLNPNAFISTGMNGVPRKSWITVIILCGIIVSVLGLSSFFLHIFSTILKQSNVEFPQEDENKRQKTHEQFDAQADATRKTDAFSSIEQITNHLDDNE